LRLDLCGLGDSVTTSVADENDSYVRTMFRDIAITLEQVQARLGVRRCILMGLCSGAYAAFQSAAQLTDPALIESILINPLTFFWRDGMSLETAESKQMIKEHYYLNAALQPNKWLKLVSGKTRIGLSGAARMLAQRVGLASLFRRPRPTVRASRQGKGNDVTHPEIQDLNADLERVVTNGRKLTMFFATTDPGYSILMRQARRRANQMRHGGQLELNFIDDADHTFSRRPTRHELIRRLVEHLGRRYVPKNDSVPSP
jgi:hypothetical protein